MQPKSTPLSPEEQSIVLEILDLTYSEDYRTYVREPLYQAQFFAENGAHLTALERYGEVVETGADLQLALTIAKSAVLAGDQAVAAHWAERAHALLEAALNVPPPDSDERLLKGLQLAKVFALLGREMEKQAIHRQLQPLFAQPHGWPGTLMECIRISAQLGFLETTIRLCLQLVPLSLGHQCFQLGRHTFGSLLQQGHEHLVWAIIGMTPDSFNVRTFLYAAILEALTLGHYDAAIRFASRLRDDEDVWNGLEDMAKALIELGIPHLWVDILKMLPTDTFGLLFPPLDQLTFLAYLAAHCQPTERAQILATARPIYEAALDSSNAEYVRNMEAMYFVVLIWAGEEAEVRAALARTRPPKHFQRAALRAAVHQGWNFLVEALWQDRLADPKFSPIEILRLELERMKAGQPNQLETQYTHVKAAALAEREGVSRLAFSLFLYREWNDLERYILWLEEANPKWGKSWPNYLPVYRAAAATGDLGFLHRRIHQFDKMYNDAHELHFVLEMCVQVRTGVGTGVKDF